MLAQSASKPFTSPEWIFEIKWDGIRAISYVNAELKIKSRNDIDLRDSFPELAELKELTHNAVLDGEIVVMKEGKADFQTVIERRSRTPTIGDLESTVRRFPATYIVFDILEKDGKPLADLPLIERKRILRDSLKEGKHVALSVFVEEQGEVYFEAAMRKGIEGIMAKRKKSTYQPGLRSGDWLKIKKLSSCDCVIFGYTPGKGRRVRTFGALILGLYDEGKPVYVGKVGTGFSRETAELLMKIFQQLEVNEKTLENVDIAEKTVWLKPELVAEAAYQTVTRDGKLRMPRFRSIRTDKPPKECTLDQIKPLNLEDYASRRDFAVTPEPIVKRSEVTGNSFVVQEHHSRRLHYDLRLEKDGVLKSWAVPKGIPERANDKRLAVETEDHPLDYRTFEGAIPKGQYGAGTVKLWDTGSYALKIWNDSVIEFFLHGEKLHGKYVLARFKKAGDKQWLLLKGKDES